MTSPWKTEVGKLAHPDEMSYQDAERLLAHLLARAAIARKPTPGRVITGRRPLLTSLVCVGAACLIGGWLFHLTGVIGRHNSAAGSGAHRAITRGDRHTSAPSAGRRTSSVTSPGGQTDQATTSPASLGIAQPPIGQDPFLTGGKKVPLRKASAAVGYTIVQPHAPRANPSIVSEVWVKAKEAVLDYRATGVQLTESPKQQGAPATTTAIRRHFAAQAAASGETPSAVQTIDGVPALVLSTQGNGATINLFLRGLTLVITGPAGMSTTDLAEVANTLS